jgi:DNA-binding beta-propeller fold protein YncE
MSIYKIFTALPSYAAIAMLMLVGCSATETAPDKPLADLVYPAAPEQARFFFERMLLSSLDVDFETEDSKISRYLTGTGRIGQGMLKPFDIATHKGRIFVSDPPKRTIHIFDPHEYLYTEVKEVTGGGALTKPFGIDTDNDGNLYVLDQTAGDVKIYDRNGEYLRKIGDKKSFSMPTGLAVTPDGSKVYISDTGGVSTERHHILELDVKDGKVLRTIGRRGTEDVEFNLPKDIVLDGDHLYIVDSGNFRIQVIDLKTEELILKFGSIGRRPGQFSRPKGIALDSDKNIYVSDAAFGNFQIFNNQGELLLFIGERSNLLAPAKYMLNSGIAVDEDNRVLIADQFHRKVDIFRPAALAETKGYLGVLPPPSDDEYNLIKEKAASNN